MFESFTVRRPSQGLIASLDADRFALDADAGADAAGAADGSQPSGDDNAHFDAGDGADDPDGADHGDAARAAAGEDDDEEFEEDDEPGKTLTVEEQMKKLRGALKKAKRKLGSTRAERQMLKELRDRGLSLNDLYADSREFRRVMASIESNPRLKALFSGSDTEDADRSRQPTRRAAQEDDEVTFDESPDTLGFDPAESKANRVLADGLKRVAKLERQLTRLVQQQPEMADKVNRLDQEFTRRQATEIRTEWKSATDAAAAQIKSEGLRTVFKDLMLFAREREGGKRPAQFFVNHYLKQIGVDPQQARRASDAAATQRTNNRVAERVTQLPRQPGQNGTPAPARKTRETLADVHKRIRSLGR